MLRQRTVLRVPAGSKPTETRLQLFRNLRRSIVYVVVDYPSRTLYARLPDSLTGLGRSHWTQAWQQLKLDEERGWGGRAPALWASTPTAERVARVTAGEGQQLKVFLIQAMPPTRS